eukprot:5651881-Amphidinium_carterae.2
MSMPTQAFSAVEDMDCAFDGSASLQEAVALTAGTPCTSKLGASSGKKSIAMTDADDEEAIVLQLVVPMNIILWQSTQLFVFDLSR